jgi:hypothetical protein
MLKGCQERRRRGKGGGDWLGRCAAENLDLEFSDKCHCCRG